LDNFLTHERLDFHDGQTKGETLDLRELASEATKSWAHLLHRPNQLRLELGDQVVPVCADRAMMTLALSNLIDNALKYSPLESQITLRVGTTQVDGWIEVEDHGNGLSADEIGHIFEKFYRGGDAQKAPGAGLGLYLVRSIARRQGGEIEVESTLGKGSRFRLRLALVP
jgi:signal transduction histidine kinase